MLKEKKVSESYVIDKSKQVFAVYPTGEKRKVQGCKVRAELNKKIADIKDLIEQFTAKISELEHDLYLTQKLDNDLASAGYCKLDTPVYKKVEGIVIKNNGKPIIDYYAHNKFCKGIK